MPAILKEPKPVARQQDRQWSFSSRLLVSALRLLIVVAIDALMGGGWYLSRKGFGRQWRSRVVEELHKRGVEASIRRLTIDPFRGLIAQDVRIFDYRNREKTLAIISEIALDINYAALIHHQPFLNALDIQNAQITLPLKSAEGKTSKPLLRNLRAHVYFPPAQIYVSQAEGLFCVRRGMWRDQSVNTDQWEWLERAGSFEGRASGSGKREEADLQAPSPLDLKTFLEALGAGDRLADVTFVPPPLIELTGDADL